MSDFTPQTRRVLRSIEDIRKGPTEDEEQRRARLYLDELTARIIDTPDGQRLLKHWRAVTIEMRNAPDVSDGALRWSEAQRSFVANEIERRIERHRKLVMKG